jgi:polysaccharide pyruvyl transferase WcaK-like protein
MRKVLFSGYYGHGNAGDDVFCAIAGLLRRQPQTDYFPWFLAESVPSLAGPSVLAHQRIPRWVPARARVVTSALACRHVVQFGGSTLQRLTPTRAILMKMARAHSIQLSAVGVSIGPFATVEAARDVQRFLATCTEVVVRDHRSLEAANELGLQATLGFDPAVLLPGLVERTGALASTSARPTIGVSISAAGLNEHPDDSERGPRFTRLASLLKNAQLETGALIRLINMQSNCVAGDDRATAWLAARLDATGPVEVHTHRGDVVSTLEAIRGCTAVIGVRLHSCILAYSVGVPFVLVDYHSKCGDFLETIGAPHARADTRLDNLDAVAHALERALARTQGPPRVPAAVAVDRCLAALGATRVWHGLNDRKDNP